MVLFGNKSDLSKERVIPFSELQFFAKSKQLDYLEGSAKERINIDEVFQKVVRLDGRKGMQPPIRKNIINNNNNCFLF